MFRAGQAIIWRHECRGGYGYVERIPGFLVRATPKRLVIRVQKHSGEWVERAVRPEHVLAAPRKVHAE